MFFWFVAVAVCTVLFVFDSPAADYRFVAAGGVAPLLEALILRPGVLHTLVGSVLALVIVMAVTPRRRLLRRRLLGLPIGMLAFLAAGGVWARTDLFWWPAMGLDAITRGPLPEFDRPPILLAVMELIGIGVLVWLGCRFDLVDPDNRRRLLSTGRLPRDRLR